MGRLDAPNPLGYSCAGVADDLLRVRFGMNLPEPDSFVVVACPDTEIGFSWEGGNRLGSLLRYYERVGISKASFFRTVFGNFWEN
jgi:hypothetical protein